MCVGPEIRTYTLNGQHYYNPLRLPGEGEEGRAGEATVFSMNEVSHFSLSSEARGKFLSPNTASRGLIGSK